MSENCVVLMRTRQRAVARLGSGVWDYGNMPCTFLAALGMRVACLVLLVFSFHFVESTVPAIEGRPHICFVSQIALKCLLILYCTPAHGGDVDCSPVAAMLGFLFRRLLAAAHFWNGMT